MLLTPEQLQQLHNNRITSRENGDKKDHNPVVKLFTPDAQCTWLLTELYPDEPSIGFGLCDLGMGCPELGDVSLTELQSVRGKMGLPIEKDEHFTATKTISQYAKDASRTRRIVA